MTIAAATAMALLAGCTSAPQSTTMASRSPTKEYFAESEYGVKASPRVSTKRSRLKRGGGREQLGKPYKIKGKWYRPQEDPDYVKVGAASWYGDAFHGRLTANGEIYDMTHLTAAHPTMPLPSYARVTNTANGASVVVRVNDRGPFAHNRIIDLSKRAAELLDYTHAGVAEVKVEYVGRAPLHGEDDEYLMASYRPGRSGVPDPGDGLPTGVMIAMAGPTPTGTGGTGRAAPFPGQLTNTGSPSRESLQRAAAPGATVVMAAGTAGGMPAATPALASGPTDAAVAPAALPADFALPSAGPLVPERPAVGLVVARATPKEPRLLAYADRRVSSAARALEDFAPAGLAPAAIAASPNGDAGKVTPIPAAPYVAAGSFASREAAAQLAEELGGRVVQDGRDWTVVLAPTAGRSLDEALELAWARGADGAFIVRD